MRLRTLALFGVCVLSFASAVLVVSAEQAPPEVAALQQADPPPNGVWVDTLDLTATQPFLRRGRGPGTGNRAGATPATPPPAPVYALGGITYPHAVPLSADRDMTIDLRNKAVRFASMVGIDSSVQAGRGSVIFGVWVDGKKVADSGVLKAVTRRSCSLRI